MRFDLRGLRGLCLLVLCLASLSVSGATFTVTNTNNSGPGSLEQAILDAKRGDTVAFAIGSGPQTIRPKATLASIRGITVDGRTQPGYTGTPLIEIDGSEMATVAVGSALWVEDASVYALAINNVQHWAISAFNSKVIACHLGTNAAGTAVKWNGQGGIRGYGTFADNLITGNAVGISVGARSTISGNRFGTDVTGKQLLGPRSDVQLVAGSNSANPVVISNNIIGGGNTGILIQGGTHVTIQNNHVGVAVTGQAIRNESAILVVGSSDIAVTQNTIARNGSGVTIAGTNSLRNSVLNNVIRNNDDLGIDLGAEYASNGPTANDAGDGDAGANNYTNYPVITRATSRDGQTTITGTLNAAANRTYTIELFVNQACNASGYGEGATRLVSFTVATNSNGVATFTQNLTQTLKAGQVVTATATSSADGTSEFSPCVAIEGPGGFVLSAGGSLIGFQENSTEEWAFEVRRVNGAAGVVTVDYAFIEHSAFAGVDFIGTNGTFTFADGETAKSIKVKMIDNSVYEGARKFDLVFSNPTGGATLAAPSSFFFSIHDDEPVPVASTSNVSAAEGNSGITALQFPVVLSGAADMPITVSYSTADGTAASGADFDALSGSVTFAPGETLKTVTVNVRTDALWELDESFALDIAWSVVQYQTRTATGTIVNDDAVPVITVTGVTVQETDGTSQAVVTLSADQPIVGTVDFVTQASTASVGTDFEAQEGTITFTSETAKSVTFAIVGDDVPEDTEQFSVTFARGSGPSEFSMTSAVVIVITDDDLGVGPKEAFIPIGDSRDGVIQAGGPAPSDTAFQLTSSDTDVVQVPATIVLPAGSARTNFEMTAVGLGAATVTVALPPSFGGGTAVINVSTYIDADLSFSPDLSLATGQTRTIHATLRPANTVPVRLRLSSSSTVLVPESFVIAPGGAGTFEVKGMSAGRADVTATLPADYGSKSTSMRGRVTAAASVPTIFSVAPPDGPAAGGTTVNIKGSALRQGCIARFGGVVAASTFVDAQTIRAIAPAHAAGVVDVTLTCGTDVATLARAFTYRDATPQISAVTPATGTTAGGTFVRISGRDVGTGCWPMFGNALSPSAIVIDANTVDAVTPAHAAGAVEVRLLCTGMAGALANGFTYAAGDDAAPHVFTVAPLSGAPGDTVTITGTGFRPRDVIAFGDVRAQILSSSPTSHSVVVPDSPAGNTSITVMRASGSMATTGPIFSVRAAAPPQISRTTAAVAIGAELVLEGSGMRAPYTFSISGKPLQIVSLLPARTIVRLPADIPPGTYAVSVLNAAGETVSVGPAVSVRSTGIVVARVESRCGSTDGNIDVVISGRGFATGALVTFDGIPATNVTVADATRITARIPANAAGPAVIAVTNADGTTSTLTDSFRYFSPFDPDACRNTPSRTRSVRH
ncbi:MAG TPA: Calx-beta domain-containing protein [Thermoanaerobaculia bacterium]|nr:Calx-beta domain-containing protein [Thermoanaerobaculia bacterium]